MKNFWIYIKSLFGLYEPEHEYWVKVDRIKVDPRWRRTRIGNDKFRRKMRYYYSTGKLQSKIILDKNFHLLDGYSSLRIAEIKKLGVVPVYFQD